MALRCVELNEPVGWRGRRKISKWGKRTRNKNKIRRLVRIAIGENSSKKFLLSRIWRVPAFFPARRTVPDPCFLSILPLYLFPRFIFSCHHLKTPVVIPTRNIPRLRGGGVPPVARHRGRHPARWADEQGKVGRLKSNSSQ